MTRAARDIPQITLRPLNQDELDVTLALLAADLSKPRETQSLVERIGKIELAEAVSVEFDNVSKGARKKRVRQPKWELTAIEHLPKSQMKWRSAARGPDKVHSQIMDFDQYQLENYRDFRIPAFTIKNLVVHQSRNLFHPQLCIRVDSISDIFDWLLVRATANRQLSRFVHCVVCGAWLLKERAGQRSARVRKLERKFDREFQVNHKPPTWPDFMYSLPSWPGVCASLMCQSKFVSIFPDKKRRAPRCKFRVEDFRGLRATTRMPTGMPVLNFRNLKTEPSPR